MKINMINYDDPGEVVLPDQAYSAGALYYVLYHSAMRRWEVCNMADRLSPITFGIPRDFRHKCDAVSLQRVINYVSRYGGMF